MRAKDRYPYVGVTVLVLLLLLLAVLVPYPANSASCTVLITSVYYDTYLTCEPEEAFNLMNVSESAVDLTTWAVTDGTTEGTTTLSDTMAAAASVSVHPSLGACGASPAHLLWAKACYWDNEADQAGPLRRSWPSSGQP